MTAHKEYKYFHVYREVNQDRIFIDEKDYQVFLGFLKDCFSDTTSLESAKKTFTVRGRTFQGIPRQPQNYFKKLKLIAYKIEPNRFDLVIKQIVPGASKKLIRALSTRYAIYFNKRHHRIGSLFKDSYQSVQIHDESSLVNIINDLHKHDNKYSSGPEYLNQRVTEWINTQDVLSIAEHISPPKTKLRIPEIMLSAAILTFCTFFSVQRIHSSQQMTTSSPATNTVNNSVNQKVLGDEEKAGKIMVVIKINDDSESVNIRQGPSTSAQKIGQAKQDERFELVSEETGWYQIKLSDGSSGFVSERYSEIRKEDN